MQATCYMLTQKGTLMPATLTGYAENGLAVVASPTGTEYTCNPGNLVSLDDAAQMLRHRRAEQLADKGYVIGHLFGPHYRVDNPQKHGSQGGYIVNIEQGTCNCPDAAKGNQCKHVMGAADMLRRAQVQATIEIAA